MQVTEETPRGGVFALTAPLVTGSLRVQIHVSGDAINPTHLARVRMYLALAESTWQDRMDVVETPRRNPLSG